MYSGTTFTSISGRVLGAHQKIDRVARDDLKELLKNDTIFPKTRKILHFEGKNGPDGIKRKSPAKDEPWHYLNPFDESDTGLQDYIAGHYATLVEALKERNQERSAFEAAWLAHALVDGLTPAHHFPYEEKLTELRGGEGLETRTTIKKKLIMPGKTRRAQLNNNWKMWGPGGLFTTHNMFELGVATVIAPMKLKRAKPDQAQILAMRELGLPEWFKRTAREVSAMGLFERFSKRGWTIGLARDVRRSLAPLITETVTLAWYSAAIDAGLVKEPK